MRFEIFILHYKGIAVLESCLASLSNTVSNSTCSVTVICNGTPDFDVEEFKRSHPNTHLIILDKNHGYSKGYNLGIAQRLKELQAYKQIPDYLVLLNNDTEVNPQWLNAVESECAKHEQAPQLMGSRTLFKDKFLVLKIETPEYNPLKFGSRDERSLGVFLSALPNGKNIISDPNRFKYSSVYPLEGKGRWLSPEAYLYIPVLDHSVSTELSIEFENHNAGEFEIPINISSPHLSGLKETIIAPQGKPSNIVLSFDSNTAVDVIQNAGSILNKDFTGQDRGFLEIDSGQYSQIESVNGICGVSLFIKTSLWEELKGFDESFYSYYEDMDLSLRARLKGVEPFYIPKSELRHLHCGSSIEHSDYFNQTVSESLLVFRSKYMPQREWKEVLNSLKKKARHELSMLIKDRKLRGKTALKTLFRYYQKYPLFLYNRRKAEKNKPWEHIFNER